MKNLSFDGVIFDLDGVITKTATTHGRAWKKMFDEYLQQREKQHNEPFKEFTHAGDYLPHVDGKPRYKGVDDFLKSRNIDIPFGDPSDDTSMETVCGLGNRKNIAFNQVLEDEGVEVFQSTVDLMKLLKENGIRIGVASSSKNCETVLKAAKLEYLVETRVDGVVSAELGLKGKPEADIFTVASDNLGLKYHKTVIVEDAESGVQAGRNGNFGLVLGLARENNKKELLANGADVAVEDIEEFGLDEIENWFTNQLPEDNWKLSYNDYNKEKEKTREALLTVGNGYLGTRGAFEENTASDIHYPGTYIAGLYNRMESKVGDRLIENEDFVNCPNWIHISFIINSGEWLDLDKVEILQFKRNLDFRNGLMTRDVIIRDNEGFETRIVSQRIASMQNPHLASIKYSITPLNYSGKINVKSVLDGNIINDGIVRYRELNQDHLKDVTEGYEDNYAWVMSKTKQSEIDIAVASRLDLYYEGKLKKPDILNYTDRNAISSEIEVNAFKNETITIEKVVAYYTSKKDDNQYPLATAKSAAIEAGSFDQLLENSEKAWKKIWDRIDIKIVGDRLAQKLLRLHLYHIIVSMSPHNEKIDASATARGLHGEAYRGHIFWDELYILPVFNLYFPETARAMLMYRYKRLDKACEYANQYEYEGAMYPWQSGSDGREETQIVHLNPVSGKWGDDYSSLQRHVSLAIAYNIWHYYNASHDTKFLSEYGAEMFLEIARFWASKAEFKAATGRFTIANVMGPDEFHEKYPDSKEGGLRDNAYSNIMASWVFERSFKILDALDKEAKHKVFEKINLSEEELKFWKNISNKLNLDISDEGIISQYEGYFDLLELDWDAYREKYGNIHRMDRILKAEGKSADNYKVAKQADTLMTFYNLPEKHVTDILKGMNYKLPDDYLKRNLEYYLQRTSHGSTLSRVVHAQLANMIGDYQLSWDLYVDALTSDYNDIQGGTTGEGIHLGVMAGTVMIAINTFAGVDFRNDILNINPSLPEHWNKINFKLNFKEANYAFEIDKKSIKVKAKSKKPVSLEVKGKNQNLEPNKQYRFNY